jgi:HlyD family secretion protein
VSAAFVVSLLANAALAGVLAYVIFFRPPAAAPTRPTDADRPANSTDAIEALGRVQPTGGVISVFGPPGDRVLELKVKLGDPVEKGALLAVLSGDKERELTIKSLTAQKDEADRLRVSIEAARSARLADLKAEVAQARAKADAEEAALDARIKGVADQLARAEAELQRLRDVQASNVNVPAQQLSQAEGLVNQLRLERDASAEQKARAADQRKAAEQSAAAKEKTVEAETQRGLAQVPGESLAAGIAAAKQKAASAELRAPVSGKVVKVGAEAGDTLTNGPVLQLADTSRMSVVAEVYETRVDELRAWLARAPGNSVGVEVDARVLNRPTPLRGTVTPGQIAPMIARNQVFALGPREDADRRVVEVEVRLDPASSEALAGYIGLQVRARFLPPGK